MQDSICFLKKVKISYSKSCRVEDVNRYKNSLKLALTSDQMKNYTRSLMTRSIVLLGFYKLNTDNPVMSGLKYVQKMSYKFYVTQRLNVYG